MFFWAFGVCICALHLAFACFVVFLDLLLLVLMFVMLSCCFLYALVDLILYIH